MTQYDRIYISPHLDDVVLSCGGTVSQQTAAGETVLVITTFAGDPAPGPALSPFAQQLHTRWETPKDATATRRREDLAALRLLDAAGEHWSRADCIYRQTPSGDFPYDSEESLWGNIHPAEESLVDELAGRMLALPLAREGTLYAPLGVGGHVDHNIIHTAAITCGKSVVFYEDFPYSRDPKTVSSRLTSVRWKSRLSMFTEKALDAKIAAIGCYRSQLSTFWASLEALGMDIRASSLRAGAGRPAERFWHQDL